MGIYFCDIYINTDTDEKEVERDMYAAILYFQGSNDHIGIRSRKMILKNSLVILF